MIDPNLGSRIIDRVNQKLGQLEHRLAELDDSNLRAELAAVQQQIATAQAELDAARARAREDAGDIALEARLEARVERLLTQKEHCQLRLELLEEKRERIREAMESLRATAGGEAQPRPVVEPRPAPPTAGDSRKLQDEQKKILEMLQAGRINADEAAQLLDALRKQDDARQRRRIPRWVRIRVTDTRSNRIRVNLTLPVGLVRAGLRAGSNIVGVEKLNGAELEDMLNRGEVGHFIDVIDEEDGEHVEVFVE